MPSENQFFYSLMKQILRSSLILMLTAVFLVGTTGVSFYIHECRSSNTKAVFAFPGIIKHHSSCSCQDEMESGSNAGNDAVSLSDPGCCKNTHLYLKASFTGFPVFAGIKQFLVEKIHYTDLLLVDPANNESVCNSTVTFQDHSPPPLFGRILIQAIHQIKIPVPFS